MKYKQIRVLCLDFDGTIRRSKSGGFITGRDDIELIEGVAEKVQEYVRAGYVVLGITNQGGVAHGYKTEDEIRMEVSVTFNLFIKEINENPFYAWRYCPFHPEGTIEKYTKESLFRKPNTGMLVSMEEQLYQDGYFIDWANSLFVGDRDEDRMCAETACIPFCEAHNFLERNV